ncbi:MAG: DedA family protein [Gammaproteobacteria bacterium]|nr:DedA family protein [Gammaproteobacteria bacterium]
MSDATLSLLAIFGSGFLASTLLPGGSEAALLYAVNQQPERTAALWLAATSGNMLGGLSSWLLGFWLRHRFPARSLDRSGQRALARVQRYGAPVLLLSWLPLVGDPLCLAAGWLGIRLTPATLYIGLGKGIRYALLLSLI